MCTMRASLSKQLATAEADNAATVAELGAAKSASVSQLTAERETLLRVMKDEVCHIETDTTFSLDILSATLAEARVAHRIQGERLDQVIEEYRSHKSAHADAMRAAEASKAELKAELAARCAERDRLRETVKQLTAALAEERRDKRDKVAARDQAAQSLKAELAGTRDELTGQLEALASEAAERELQLEEEGREAAVASRLASKKAADELSRLEREKQEREAALKATLAASQAEAHRQASALQTKIENMKRLQELALGGGSTGKGGGRAGEDGDDSEESAVAARLRASGKSGALVQGGALARRVPSSQGRQYLYWESLKSNRRAQSSMSWRGQDVFAHNDAAAKTKNKTK